MSIFPTQQEIIDGLIEKVERLENQKIKLIDKNQELVKALKIYLIDLKNIVSPSPARDNRINEISNLIK